MDDLTYEKAIEHFGSPAELARRLGIKPQAVYQWDGVIPPLRKYEIRDLMESDNNNPEAA